MYLRSARRKATEVTFRPFGLSQLGLNKWYQWAEMTGQVGGGQQIQSSAWNLLILRPLSIQVDLQNKAVGNMGMKLRAEVWAGDINWQSYFPGGDWRPRWRGWVAECWSAPAFRGWDFWPTCSFLHKHPRPLFNSRRSSNSCFYSFSLPSYTNSWPKLILPVKTLQ